MKKSTIVGILVIIILISIGGFWIWKSGQNKKVEMIQQKNQIESQDQQQNQEKKKEFMVDVDPNVDNWQTKEAEFFLIKFPKEWYWLESVITNNPNFNINKYANIGIFTGGNYPLVFTNNTEMVISFNGSATTDAGTPQQSIDSKIRWIQESFASAKCDYFINLKVIPSIASCSFLDKNRQKVQIYFIANETNTIFFAARATEDNLVKKDILDKMARSMILKK